jgi:hypothetical protein
VPHFSHLLREAGPCSVPTSQVIRHRHKSAQALTLPSCPRISSGTMAPGTCTSITCSCLSARAGLGSARRRDLYLGIFEQVRQRYGVVVLGYMVMPSTFTC